MKANELQINNFLQAPNVQFVIPVYQRNYDWTNTECKELLNYNYWGSMNQFFLEYLPKFENAFRPFIKNLK
jgi:hypothetical protein